MRETHGTILTQHVLFGSRISEAVCRPPAVPADAGSTKPKDRHPPAYLQVTICRVRSGGDVIKKVTLQSFGLQGDFLLYFAFKYVQNFLYIVNFFKLLWIVISFSNQLFNRLRVCFMPIFFNKQSICLRIVFA